jgi:hypothetical protein
MSPQIWDLFFVSSAGGCVGVLWCGGIDVAEAVFGRVGLDLCRAWACSGWVVALRPGRLDGMARVRRWMLIAGLICVLVCSLLIV